MSSSTNHKGSSRPLNTFRPDQRQTPPATSTISSTNIKKRARVDDDAKDQPPQKRPVFKISLGINVNCGIKPRPARVYIKAKVNGKVETRHFNSPEEERDSAQKAKRDAAERLARREQALRKKAVEDLDKVSKVKPSATVALPLKGENRKRAVPSSAVGVSGIPDGVEKGNAVPPQRRRRLVQGLRPAPGESEFASTTTSQKGEKRKRADPSSEEEEVQPAKLARRQMCSSERRDPERKRANPKDEVLERPCLKEPQSTRRAFEKKEKPGEEEKKEAERKEVIVSEEENGEPHFDTYEEVAAWFAKKYPHTSGVSGEMAKQYIKPPPETEAQRSRRAKEVEEQRMQRIRQARYDEMRSGQARNEEVLHVKPTKERIAMAKEQYRLMNDRIVRNTGHLSPPSSPGRPTSEVASEQTDLTSAEPSPKGPSSPVHSEATPSTSESDVYPPPPPYTFKPSTYYATTSSFGQVKFEHTMTEDKQIKQRVANINDQVSKTKEEKAEHEANVTSFMPRRGWGFGSELKEELDQQTQKLDEKLKDAEKKQKCYHRNIDKVTFGPLEIPAWYSSDYQNKCVGSNVEKPLPKKPVVDNLYVCQNCFAYTTNIEEHAGHSFFCPNEIPGEKVYDHAGAGVWGVWQVDGETDKLFCQNISLFAKLFLADKTVSYHTKDFYYFLLVHTDTRTGNKQIVGFFSKEKNSYDGNNLACILVFPPWQGMGLGKMLMGISYEISRMEEIIGGPERPFSSLGEKSYKRYWQAELARWILSHPTTDKKKGCLMVDIQRISRETCILERDCIDTINSMELDLLPKYPSNAPEGGQPLILDKDKVRKWVQVNKVNLDRVVDASGFVKKFSKRTATVEDEEEDDD